MSARSRQAPQRLVLRGAIVLRCHHYNAPFAFHLAADIAHEAIDGDRIAPFVEPLDHDIDFVSFHRHRPTFTTTTALLPWTTCLRPIKS
jgi:hypothetical protein